jgi:hypothetical protein
MTTIATFPTPEDAHLFRLFLESRGIVGFLQGEYISQLFWIYNNATGGVRMEVADEDAEEAAALYHEYMASLRSGPYPETTVRGWPLVVMVSLLVGVPFLLFGRRRSGPE